jgi:hypothetical protein
MEKYPNHLKEIVDIMEDNIEKSAGHRQRAGKLFGASSYSTATHKRKVFIK